MVKEDGRIRKRGGKKKKTYEKIRKKAYEKNLKESIILGSTSYAKKELISKTRSKYVSQKASFPHGCRGPGELQWPKMLQTMP